MKFIKFVIFLLSLGEAFAQSPEDSALTRLGGASAVAAIQSEGLAGAVRLSRDCIRQVASDAQSAHYCLGVEAASMLSLRRGAAPNPAPDDLRWFDGNAMTERVLSYCYSALGLKGDMQCLEQMGKTKAMVEPLVLTFVASETGQ